tara:strand:- start:242 stop:1135 length:894 start_codon:yes stop_codon:yes gene_type:complete
MRVLLTGSTGQLGKAIKCLKPKEIKLIETTRNEINLNSKSDCFKKIEIYKPDWIINAAAFTNVDLAETNFREAYKINSLAPKYFAESILKYGGKLLQISTDYVFDGSQNKPYKIGDLTNPINNYGISKAAGENNIIEILGDSQKGIILRTSWLMSPNKVNFLTKMLSLFEEKNEINVVSDQISCPTSTSTLAKMCWQIIKKEKAVFQLHSNYFPILHCCDKGKASWYEVALSIYEYGRRLDIVKNDCLIRPVKSAKYPSLAKRPLYSLLDCERSFELLNFRVNNWKKELYESMTKIV